MKIQKKETGISPGFKIDITCSYFFLQPFRVLLSLVQNVYSTFEQTIVLSLLASYKLQKMTSHHGVLERKTARILPAYMNQLGKKKSAPKGTSILDSVPQFGHDMS